MLDTDAHYAYEPH